MLILFGGFELAEDVLDCFWQNSCSFFYLLLLLCSLGARCLLSSLLTFVLICCISSSYCSHTEQNVCKLTNWISFAKRSSPEMWYTIKIRFRKDTFCWCFVFRFFYYICFLILIHVFNLIFCCCCYCCCCCSSFLFRTSIWNRSHRSKAIKYFAAQNKYAKNKRILAVLSSCKKNNNNNQETEYFLADVARGMFWLLFLIIWYLH